MYIKDFCEIQKNDIPVAGGKGANLGEMASAGINIPAGFVITADAYRLFVKENNYEKIFTDTLAEAGNDEQKLTVASARLREYILKGNIPTAVMKELSEKYEVLCNKGAVRVAVRSSATAEDLAEASFAGQQETYLGIKGLDEVAESVRKCYASLWGTRAVIYRNNLGFNQADVALAVVVQTMVPSEKAGVLFTADPISNNPDTMRINSSFGLGESVVSGRVTADSILVNKSGKVISYDCGLKLTQIIYDDNFTKEVAVAPELQGKPSLSEDEIMKLCHEGLLIEKHYGKPMDIEWGITGDKVYILQARPITTIKPDVSDDESALVQSYIAGSKIYGPAKSNMAFQLEKMPYAYRPLDYDIIMQINHQKAVIFSEAGLILTSDPQMDDDGIMTLPDPHKGISKNIIKLPSVLKEVKDFEHCAKICNTFMPAYEKDLSSYANINYDSLSLKECTSMLEKSYDLLGRLCYDRFKYALFPSVLGGSLTRAVKKIDKNLSNYDLLRGLDNKTAVVTKDVAALASKISEDEVLSSAVLSGKEYLSLTSEYPVLTDLVKPFLNKNGFKSDFNCYCVEAKTLKEDPDRLLNIIRPLIDAKKEQASDNSLSYEDIMARLKELYKSDYPKLERNIEAFRTFHLVREESQYLWETLFFYVRKVLARLNSLLMGSDDYIHGISNLFYRELIDVCHNGVLDEPATEKINRRNCNSACNQIKSYYP